MKIWIVSTCIPEPGEKPCIPSPFATEAEAEAYADARMREEWEVSEPHDDADEPELYPGDWRAAQRRLVEWNGPEWGTWEITVHDLPAQPSSPDNAESRKFLDASTAHVSEESAKWLDEQGRLAAAVNTDDDEHPVIQIGRLTTGWFFYADPEDAPFSDPIPADVVALMREARKRGCHYVLLDRDAPAIDGLPVYEW